MDKVKGQLVCVIIVIESLLFVLFPAITVAVEYPTKPITLIVPFGAGGTIDVLSRSLADIAKRHLGQPIIVENKPGAASVIGYKAVISKPPDGYTIGTGPVETIINRYIMGMTDFHPVDDVTHIMRLWGWFNVIAVRTDAPWKTIQEFIQYCKANPGKVSYGTSGVGLTPHMYMLELASLYGLDIKHIPYKSGAEDYTALMGGHIDALSDGAWAPAIQSGKVRFLLAFVNERSPKFPQVPTPKEIGIEKFPSSNVNVFGPKGLPTPIVRKLHDAFKMTMDDPEYKANLEKFNLIPLYLNSEDSEKEFRKSVEPMRELIKKFGLKKD